jgi:hypothetical protein
VSEIATVPASDFLTEGVLRESLTSFDHVRLAVTGGCMSPELAPGDTVLVASIGRRPPRFGNIVLALFPNGPRLHRLVWRPPWGAWRTKADRARALDPPLRRSQVLGTVIGVDGRARLPARRWRRGLASLLGAVAARLARG